MDASDLTPEQRQRILDRLQPMGAYLFELSRRLQRRGWHPDAPEYVNTVKAHQAIVEIGMALRYAGTGQAWEPPEERRPEPAPPLLQITRRSQLRDSPDAAADVDERHESA